MSELPTPSDQPYDLLHEAIVTLVLDARRLAARRVNSLMTAAYWEIGRRIVAIVQGGAERAAYGEALVERLAHDLSGRFGRGFSTTNLKQMRSFYQAWPAERIRQTASDQSHGDEPGVRSLAADRFPLPWSAYVALLAVKNDAARLCYQDEALRGGWSVRQLRRQVESQFYERTALSRDKVAMLSKGRESIDADTITPEEAIKDPYVLEFLDLKDEYSESELEAALIERLTDFLLELGDDFAFVSRQRRIRLDDSWFRVDLVFFHRRLRCLVIIDLKVGRFGYADAGQMHLYLNYAQEHWMKPGENPPVGLILAASSGDAEVRYALDGLPNTVLASEYRTVLPDEKLLADELARARRAIERHDKGSDRTAQTTSSATDKDGP